MTPQEKAVFVARAMLRTGLFQNEILEAFAALYGQGSDYRYLVSIANDLAYRKGVLNASFSLVY